MKKISTKEFIWYAVCGIIVVFGFICMIFGIVGYHMGGMSDKNFILTLEAKLPFALRYWGLIFMAIGVVIAIICLLVNAKKADREYEKKIRREQRIAVQNNSSIEVKNAVEIVEEPKPKEPEVVPTAVER